MNQTKSTQQVKTFGDWANLAIAKHYKKIIKTESGVIQDKDPEELHQMRVGMRRLRSAIAGFAPALDLPETVSDKNIGKIARILGKLRDLDVLQQTLTDPEGLFLLKEEQKSSVKILKELRKKRREALDEVRKTLKRNCYQNFKKDLKDWLEKPQYQKIGKISIYEVLPDLLLPEVSKLLIHPGWLVGVTIEEEKINIPEKLDREQVGELLETEEKNLHSLRKQAKRSRYNMELFTQFYGDSYEKFLKQIKQIQEVLGEIQDCVVLANFASKIFGSADINKEIPTLAAQLATKRYQKWSEWIVLQRQFLDRQTKQDLRLVLQQPNSDIILTY